MRKIIFALLIAMPACGYTFTKAGFYTIDSSGWIAKSTPSGDVFICEACPDMVQVQISYGPQAGGDSPFKSNSDFLNAFSTKEKKERFAKMMMDSSMPSSGFEIKIIRVDEDHIGTLKALRYSASIKMPDGNIGRETTLVAFHKNRLVKFSANFYDNKLNEKSATALDNLHKSIDLL
ncbi:hypothetical protein [Serratia liquefaciens]|uniref:hypothetical protein n=1 Tax=Serratia liquefaciens TaxID=614 RepID=UPI00217A83F1|nr:hypothetical protein [Serratia liquefaciens]CAI1211135.1 Uncharacterised protein [Serratia liquefaciens]